MQLCINGRNCKCEQTPCKCFRGCKSYSVVFEIASSRVLEAIREKKWRGYGVPR